MKLTFLGTRGYIEARSRLHRRHSALMVETGQGRAMFDCGADWLGRVFALAPDAILLTHAHPDHAEGLRSGAPCPVYASAESWRLLAEFPIAARKTINPERGVRVCGLKVRAFPLVHSILCPAVGYRVEADGAAFFYAPDVVAIADPVRALRGVDLYVGDGSSPTRPLVRRRDGALFGHTTIRAQLGWCAKAGIPEAIFTHCGTAIVTSEARAAAAQVGRMGEEKGVRARIAKDSLELVLGSAPTHKRS
jgi:phosphoribosyl 1,2-cyclic phosphodiesterase